MTQPLSHNLNGDDFAVVDEVMRGNKLASFCRQQGVSLLVRGFDGTGYQVISVKARAS
jgi:hypothetical protein